ncbi:MAG: tetratricopeptide repeat protein [Bryobacteraceae bacterium]
MNRATVEAADNPIPADRIRTQLAIIVASGGFVSSPRLCRFLRFIVERTLENDAESLKEYVLAIEVFDRAEDYDPNIDSIVRVEARRLRNKLKAYYEGAGGQDAVLIGLRPGSYVPQFGWQNRQSESHHAPALASIDTTIAVLPFVNMSPEPDQDYFCDGITEEIINALSSIRTLAVVARTSSFQYKGRNADVREVGEKLGANVIVEGSVRKSGSRLRITAQAIDTKTGYHLWSETYRRELADVFAIQEEISTAIAETVHANLPRRPRPNSAAHPPSLEAYTGYFRAMHLVHQETAPSLQLAMEQFQVLIREYPAYADPYAGIATVYAALSIFGAASGKEILPELRRHAEEAVRLDPDSSAGWTVMAGIAAHWEFDWAEAERRFRRAIALQPSNYAAHSWFGGVLAMLGRFDEAESKYRLAMKLNPLFPSAYARLGFLCYLRRDGAGAARFLNESLRLAPDYEEARFVLGMLHLAQGDNAAAVEVLSRRLDEAPIPLHIGMLAGAYHRWGKRAECAKALARLERIAGQHYVTPMARVAACVGMGDLDGAMQALAASIEDRAIFANVLNVDPFVDPIRADPRFQRLVASMNLPPRRAG